MIAQSAKKSLGAYMGRDIDFGIMNAGGVRADLAKGEITYQAAFTVQPFGNDISFATITGATLKEMLENQWKNETDGRPRLDIGLSDNVSYVYNPEAPRGEKILNITIDGEPVEADKVYSFAASTFLLSGGDGFIPDGQLIERIDVGYNDLQAFIDYLASGDAQIRQSQKDVGVVLPEGGLKAGQKNEIKLTSLSYSSPGEPKAETATVKIGETTAEAKVNNEVTDADEGYGEQGRATVEIEIPAELAGEQTLTITTDKGTNVTMPVTVAAAEKPSEETEKPGDEAEKPGEEAEKPGEETEKPGDEAEKPSEETEKPGEKTEKPGEETEKPGEKTEKPGEETEKPGEDQASGSSEANVGVIIAAVAGVLSLLALLFAFPIDSVLGPIAKF